jgi:hypothetical protein
MYKGKTSLKGVSAMHDFACCIVTAQLWKCVLGNIHSDAYMQYGGSEKGQNKSGNREKRTGARGRVDLTR